MINTIRADFYRLKHTKGFWIAQLILILFITFSIFNQATGSVGISAQDMMEETSAVKEIPWTGTVSLVTMSSMAIFVLYFIIPLFVIALGHDFSKETYKNSLTVGVSRSKYFFSKYITLVLITALQLAYFYLMSFITGSVLNGFGDDFGKTFLWETLQSFALQLLFIMAILSFSVCLLYLTSNVIAAILTAVILPIVINLLQFFFQKITLFSWLDFQSIASQMMMTGLTDPDLPKQILTALITMGLLIIISLTTFKKREL